MSIESSDGQSHSPSSEPAQPADSSVSDEILLRRIARKDIAAFELFLDRHSAWVNGILLRIVGDVRVAEELLQEVFLRVWNKAEQFSGRGAAAAWLGRMARNRALDYRRRRDVRPQIADSKQTMDEREGSRSSKRLSNVEAGFEQVWLPDEIQRALTQIPEEQRLVIELAFFAELTHQEIAEQTDIALGTVKSRIRLGMEKLARLLGSAGFDESI